MQLENQVCSLQLSRELKEAGVPQDSFFIWVEPVFVGRHNEFDETLKEIVVARNEPEIVNYKTTLLCSAFTCAELGEMLPSHIEKKGTTFHLRVATGKNLSDRWCVYQDGQFNETATPFISSRNNTEADSRAKCSSTFLKKS